MMIIHDYVGNTTKLFYNNFFLISNYRQIIKFRFIPFHCLKYRQIKYCVFF